MKVIHVTLIIAGAVFVSNVGCGSGTPAGLDVIDALGPDSSETDAEVPGSRNLCEACTDDSECVDGTICVSIEISIIKECHHACTTDEDCDGSECVINDGRGHCDPDEPCYPMCLPDKPYLDIETRACFECLKDANCDQDQYCGDDRTCACVEKTCDVDMRQCDDCQCGACCGDADCESTEVCWDHSCLDREVPCDNECTALGMMCYTGESGPFCIDCLTDSDCPEGCTCTGNSLWACIHSDGSVCS